MLLEDSRDKTKEAADQQTVGRCNRHANGRGGPRGFTTNGRRRRPDHDAP